MKLLRLQLLLLSLAWSVCAQAPTAATAPLLSRVVEAAGVVECQIAGSPQWQPATNGFPLKPGDRIRTGAQSRSAVQFSDRSVLRLSERTTLEIQPPRQSEKRRFSLRRGLLFFFNRERPADVEFETPITAGAIRGTEFVLEASEDNGATRLALLDGKVQLSAANSSLSLESGEEARVEPGQPPRKTALIESTRVVQWALYYPAVVNPDDLALRAEDQVALAKVLETYRAGDLLAAQLGMEEIPAGSQARELLRAALALSVGQVGLAELQLNKLDTNLPVARALREVIEVALAPSSSPTNETAPGHGTQFSKQESPPSASELLARSYALQARFQLHEALQAARQAVALAPHLGFTHARVAELEWAFERRREALAQLDQALQLSPRLAAAHSLRGFILLEQRDRQEALAAFDRAIGIDSALGSAWLGKGLAQFQLGQRDEALRSLQTAVALEPRRSLHRSYLGKAWSQQREAALAKKEFRLAKDLDPNDPTAWLYSALHQWQENRPNAAVRELERSAELNDNRQLFRSRLTLDRDQAVRSANLAAIYRDAGLPEVSLRSAAHAVTEDYANYSGHLFLANSYQAMEDPNRFDLRFETARQSELLLANLLAPAGAANLSQLLSQQEHLQFFEPRPLAVSTATEYRSNGDWRQQSSFYGALSGFSYALDVAYEGQNGQEKYDWRERTDISLQLKQRITAQDELYLQVGGSGGRAGDVARHYAPTNANPALRVTENQLPNLYFGWHRAWSPASHTLFLFSRLKDSFTLRNGQQQVLFLRDFFGSITRVSTDEPGFGLDYQSDFTLYSGELQHLWQTERHAVVVGGRFQAGDVDTTAVLERQLTGVVTDQRTEESLRRGNAYTYWHWRVAQPLRLVAGLSYDHLSHPLNTETVPLTSGDTSRDLIAPKAGFLLTPWKDGQIRGSFTRSLGGVFFDNSIRLEPTQIAGFNQAYRSLLPESVAGLVPGTEFETFNLSFDQSLRSGTYFGVEAELLYSDGNRTVGALTNSTIAPVPDSAGSTRQALDFRERNLSAYAVQLLGEGLSIGARYRLSEARVNTTLPDIPRTALNLGSAEDHERAVLQQVALTLNYQHPRGFFAQWESVWNHQSNHGFALSSSDEDLWQHNLWVGWRFPRRHAELRAGVLNLTDADYRLNPLSTYGSLPRQRTAVVSLRLNF